MLEKKGTDVTSETHIPKWTTESRSHRNPQKVAPISLTTKEKQRSKVFHLIKADKIKDIQDCFPSVNPVELVNSFTYEPNLVGLVMQNIYKYECDDNFFTS